MIPPRLVEAWNDIIDFVLPRLCCGCGERVFESQWLVCGNCLDEIPTLHEPLCVTCGCPDARVKGPHKCDDCPPGKTWFTRARGVTAYAGVAQTLIEKLKYQGRIEYAHLLALGMARVRTEMTAPLPDLLIPVPLHSTRRRERGFNQSQLLAKQLEKLTKVPLASNGLKRIKPTPSQTRLKKRQRRQNIAGAFACPDAELVRGKRVMLVDDVYTTGSTLNECARVLMEAGAESVECLAYARAVLS